MGDALKEILDGVSPAMRMAVRWILLGVIITSSISYENNRVAAAENTAKAATDQVKSQQAMIDQISRDVRNVQTQQAVTQAKIDALKDSAASADKKLDLVLQKLGK